MLVLLALVLLGEDVVQSFRQSLSPPSSFSSSSSLVRVRGVETVRSPGGGGGLTGRCLLDRGTGRVVRGRRGVADPSTALRTSVEDTFDLVSIFEKNPAISLGFAGTWAVLGLGWMEFQSSKKELMKGATDLEAKLEVNRKEARDDAKAIMRMAQDDAKAIMRMAQDDAKATRREARENLILLLLIAILVVGVQSLVLFPVPP
jgi:hypothetical protein